MKEEKKILNGLNIIPLDSKNECGANCLYEINGFNTKTNPSDPFQERYTTIIFQNGDPEEVGKNGITNEILLKLVLHRLECFQKGKYPCVENQSAIVLIEKALDCLEEREARIKLEKQFDEKMASFAKTISEFETFISTSDGMKEVVKDNTVFNTLKTLENSLIKFLLKFPADDKTPTINSQQKN